MLLKIALFLHVISAIFWIGGMLFLTLVIAPYVLSIQDRQERAKIFQVVGKKLRLYGWIAIILLLITGPTVLYLIYGIPIQDAFSPGVHSTGFGRALAYKLTLVTIIVISSIIHDFYIGPKAKESPKLSRLAKIFGRTNLVIAIFIVIFAVILRTGGL